MFAFITSAVGVAAIAGYIYVAVMFGRASRMAGNEWMRVMIDATTWPVMGWTAIERLYRV